MTRTQRETAEVIAVMAAGLYAAWKRDDPGPNERRDVTWRRWAVEDARLLYEEAHVTRQ